MYSHGRLVLRVSLALLCFLLTLSFAYAAAGDLDTTFHDDGKVTTPIGGGSDMGDAVAIQPNGKIVVVGSASNGSNPDVAVVRYSSNGSLDPSFGSGGKVTVPIGGGGDTGDAVAIQPDGKIVVAGSTYNGVNTDIAVMRYQSGLTTTFGKSGVDVADYTTVGNANTMTQFSGGHACTRGIVTSTKYAGFPDGSQDSGELPMTWTIENDCGGKEFSLNLKLCYTDDELTQATGVTGPDLHVFKKVPGSRWVDMGGTADTALNCVALGNVTASGTWMLAKAAPSPIGYLFLPLLVR
jgi:uncharacterized delta-60 repeat protein